MYKNPVTLQTCCEKSAAKFGEGWLSLTTPAVCF